MTALSGPTFGLDASEELDVMDGLFFNELSDLPVEPGSAKMYGSSGPQPVVDTPITDEELIGARAASGRGGARRAPGAHPRAPPRVARARARAQNSGRARSPAAIPTGRAPAASLPLPSEKESKPKAKAAAGSKPKDAADLSETRRARNREHARRSRCRKKLIIESLQQSLVAYQGENERLREFVREKLGAEAAAPSLEYCAAQSKGDGDAEGEASLSEGGERTRAINKYDYGLLEALKHARRSFVITDPTLPDNPIVFASGGFLSLTGYKLEQVLGRNCRFLQGPRTDARAVGKIREAIKHGTDVQICLLNYKIDSTTFWNHFFIAALRDDAGDVVNFLGVQIEVSERVAMGILQNMDGKAADGKAAPAAAPADGAAKGADAAVGAKRARDDDGP